MKFHIHLIFILLIIGVVTSFSQQNEPFRILEIHSTFVQMSFTPDLRADDDFILVLREKSLPQLVPNIKSNYDVASDFLSSDTNCFVAPGYLVIYKNGAPQGFQIGNLKPDTFYSVDIFEKEKKQFKPIRNIEFTTLAEKPERQTKKLMWGNLTHNTIELLANGGSGERTLIAVSKSQNDFVPVPGTTYPISKGFDNANEVSEGVIVILGDNDTTKRVKLDNLEPGTYYYYSAFEYNGKGKSSNYATEIKRMDNSVRIPTLLETPIIMQLKKEGADGFSASWKKVRKANTYQLEIALDYEFQTIEESYGLLDVGNVDSFLLEELIPGTQYFVRVRAVGDVGFSEYSKILSIKL